MTLYLVVVAGAVVAGFVQGLSGFAFGLVAMSFWVWAVDPKVAAALTVFGGLLGQLIAAFSVRRGFKWNQLLPFVLGGITGIPVGVWLLPLVDAHTFKIGLGVILLIWCPAMLFAQRIPKISFGGRLADGVVGLAGGVLGGFGGFTGVIPTLWCVLRGFPREEQRAIIQNFNLAMLIVIMGTYIAAGLVTKATLPLFAIVAPAMLIPTFLGTRMYKGISDLRFRQIVLGLLTASGLMMLTSGLWAVAKA
ncbi:sulfite exporter TauE/SafE family protein [Achromobacter seleniivolatilans]|uniref:Probable membrane transporter protein n=1 Tax=Achromobacter seleniivolatilans TaxID=3047478 RepID=A0ABY9LZK3_9BURK|nr:sulfite exporter TauE/SafE family protein [Achromobacter sp. R39]WMD19714.1 sulfite exporter TauE/SafE family protein [Achromobacter sp. R39]